LPGYQEIGVTSYALLVFLRFVDGIFLGGGYTGAIPLAIEYSRKGQRGLVGGIIMAGFPAAYVSINLVAMVVFAIFPLHGVSSPYAQWGWRIPFFIGAILAGALALYYVFKVEESEIWKSDGKKGSEAGAPVQAVKTPLSDLLRGKSGRSLIQVLTLMSGFWLTQNIITLFLPGGVLVRTLHLSGFEMSLSLLATYFVLIFSYLGSGLLGQKIGRRRFFMIAGPLISTVGSVLLYLLANGQGYSLPTIMGMLCLLAVLVTAPWGVLITYINERFVTDVRATGFGVGFSLSVIIPSFYAFYMNWLDAALPVHVSPSVLLSVGGLIAMAGAWMGPETKNIDF
jgi:MFS family permease